jgi:hypothetical protein
VEEGGVCSSISCACGERDEEYGVATEGSDYFLSVQGGGAETIGFTNTCV